MKKDGNRLEGIGERIAVRLTLLEEALGMTPGDPEIYGNWIASKAPEPENGAEEVGVIEGMDAVEDATTCFVLVKRERICGRGFYFITKVSRKGANPVLTVDIPRVR
ncbi:MAG: hypothetical protein LKE32_02335 [Lachnospiraceae bacterium]|nr:hypothetical protein [Lachnospiraceae bacterium]